MYNERDIRHDVVVDLAKKLLVAARTAPKAKGVDIIECAIVEGDEVARLSAELHTMCEETGFMFLGRDAENILQAECLILVGTRDVPQGLNCGRCGYPTCGDRPEGVPCAFNNVDVGIALGSVVAEASARHLDTRIMYSAGAAAQRLGMLGEDVGQIYAVPLSASAKNPFFDRH